jgi:hypothetical protein
MSSQNVCLDQRMKGKEEFPYAGPGRETLAGWFSQTKREALHQSGVTNEELLCR